MSTRKEREQKKRDDIERRRAELDHASVVRHVDDGPPKGCGDSGCFIARSGGQCTNGGCRCDERALRKAVMWYRFEFERRGQCDAERKRREDPQWKSEFDRKVSQ